MILRHQKNWARFIQLLLTCGLLSLASCSVDQLWTPEGRHPGEGGAPLAKAPEEPAPLAPWEVWDSSVAGDPVFQVPDKSVQKGDLADALKGYQEIESHAISNEIRNRAFLRRLSTMLKLGRSRSVLEEVSKAVRDQGKSVDDTDPTLALFAAYSYLHLGDGGQSLVWFSLARKRVNQTGIIARRALNDATHLIMALPQDALNRVEAGVTNDAFLEGLIKEEQVRRGKGGTPEANPAMAWFNASTYMPASKLASLSKTGDVSPELNTPSASDKYTIGVLLPISGKFAAHANLVKQGIEMAVAESPLASRVRLVVADEQGEALVAGSEFDKLVQQEGAVAVLGPMLVKTSEEVARHSDSSGVPFITFTKRPGITDLSKVGFRLGATAENQCDELARYVVSQLNKKSFAIISPKDPNGEEFAQCFPTAVSRAGGQLVKSASYTPGNPASLKSAVESLGTDGSSLDAIFVPDTLERAAPLLQIIRDSAFRNALLLGPAFWNEPVAVRGYGPLLENAVIVTPFFVQSSQPQVSRFVQQYKAKFSRSPDLLTAQAYDATTVLLSGLTQVPESVPPLERTGEVAKLIHESAPREALTGKITVQANGELTREMSILRLQGGELVEVMAAGQARSFVSGQDPQRAVITAPKNLPIGNKAIPASIARESKSSLPQASLPPVRGSEVEKK